MNSGRVFWVSPFFVPEVSYVDVLFAAARFHRVAWLWFLCWVCELQMVVLGFAIELRIVFGMFCLWLGPVHNGAYVFQVFFVGLARLTWNADGFLGVRVLCARSELQLVGVELFFGARNQLQIKAPKPPKRFGSIFDQISPKSCYAKTRKCFFCSMPAKSSEV